MTTVNYHLPAQACSLILDLNNLVHVSEHPHSIVRPCIVKGVIRSERWNIKIGIYYLF